MAPLQQRPPYANIMLLTNRNHACTNGSKIKFVLKMATRPERLMNHTENLKENNKHRKPPFQQRQTVTRPPLKATNVVTQGQQPRAPATVKQPPTGCSNKKPVKTGEKQHLTAAIKCTVSEGGDPVGVDRDGDKEDEMHTKGAGAQGVDGNNTRSQLPPSQGRTLSRREQLELWRRQKNETNKTTQKPPSQTSLTSNPLKRKAVTMAPTPLHQKSWCSTIKTNPPPQKRPVQTKQSLPSSANKRPCISLLKQHQPAVCGSMPALGKTKVASLGNDLKRPLTKPGNGRTHPHAAASVSDMRFSLTKRSTGQTQSRVARSLHDLKHDPTKTGQVPPAVAGPRNDKKRPAAETSSWKRQTLCLGSTLDRKLSLISGSRLSVVRPRPVSQPSTNAPAQATQAQHISPSRRKSKRFVHVKACVDSNLTAIRSRSRMTCSPRLKLTVAPSRGANQRLSMPAHAKKTSVMGLNSKTSAGVMRTHTRMTCSPRLKQTMMSSRGVNARVSIPARTQKTAVMALKSRKSIVAPHRSPHLQGVGSKATGRHQLTDKGPVKFATPGRGESAWARSEVTPACTPLPKEQSMGEKLEAWLTSRGKTPSKYSHLMCFGHSSSHNVTTRRPASCHRHKDQSRITPGKSDRRRTFSLPDSPLVTDPTPVMDEMTDGLTVDECHPPKDGSLDGLLTECLQLLQESDCPPGLVRGWLQEIGRVPQALRHAKFWIVKAAVAEESGESNDTVVDIFEEAFRHKVEPPEEMALALKGFVERMSKRRENQAGASRKAEDVHENIFESSAVKYCMTNTTVFFKRVRSRLDTSPRRFTPHAMITPVRRSTRKKHAILPIMLQDHDTMYDALEEVPEDLRPCTLFRPNRALETTLEDSGET